MGLLDQSMGGGDRRQEYQDFTDRNDQGQPHEGYDEQEVASATARSPAKSTPRATGPRRSRRWNRWSPDDRTDYARQLTEHADSQGVDVGVPAGGPYANDPSAISNRKMPLAHYQRR